MHLKIILSLHEFSWYNDETEKEYSNIHWQHEIT